MLDFNIWPQEFYDGTDSLRDRFRADEISRNFVPKIFACMSKYFRKPVTRVDSQIRSVVFRAGSTVGSNNLSEARQRRERCHQFDPVFASVRYCDPRPRGVEHSLIVVPDSGNNCTRSIRLPYARLYPVPPFLFLLLTLYVFPGDWLTTAIPVLLRVRTWISITGRHNLEFLSLRGMRNINTLPDRHPNNRIFHADVYRPEPWTFGFFVSVLTDWINDASIMLLSFTRYWSCR